MRKKCGLGRVGPGAKVAGKNFKIIVYYQSITGCEIESNFALIYHKGFFGPFGMGRCELFLELMLYSGVDHLYFARLGLPNSEAELVRLLREFPMRWKSSPLHVRWLIP